MAKVAFIQEELRDRFGIMILSAILKQAKHRCDVFIQEKEKDIIGEISKFKPDIVAFSTMTPGINFALDYANRLKRETNAFILMGGPHPTFYPEIINEGCIDGICVGEGEFALLELANAFDKGIDFTRIKNLWIKSSGNIYKNDLRPLVDVDKLPMPDRAIYFEKYPNLKNALTKKVFIARGCPFSCTYCFNHALKKMYTGKGAYVRFLDVDKVIDEIKYVRNTYGLKWLQITADAINLKRDWFITFLDKYKREINIPFLCNIRIDRVDDEMVRKMKEANCDRVDYGIEHGDEEILTNVLKRNMTRKQIIEGGRLFNKYDIRVQTSNIIGVPHETVETAMKTIEINRHVKPELAKSCILQPYPKTQIHTYAIKHGFLEDTYMFSKQGNAFHIDFDGSTNVVPLKLNQSRQLVNLVYLFNVLVQHKWLEPLAKVLINLPFNRFFKLVYAFPMIKQEIKYSESFEKRIKSSLVLCRIIFANK